MGITEFVGKLFSQPWILATTILLGSLLVAVLSRGLFSRGLLRLTRKTKTELDDQFVQILRRPIFWTVLFLGIIWALEVLELQPSITYWIFGAMKTLAVIVWMSASIRLAIVLLKWQSAQPYIQFVQPRLLPLFNNVARVLLFGGAIYLILASWEIDVTAWLTSAGIVGIAVGFAAKDSLANLFAGIFILTDAPYKLGDYINLDTGERGRVTDIGIRSTRLLTRDDVEITLPNTVIANAKIINESGGPYEKERVRLNIGVAYGSDIDLVRKVLIEVAETCPLVVAEPTPRVRFREFGDSSLNFQLLFWIELPETRGRTLDALNGGVYKRFQREGIEIPFPQRDVHLQQWPGPLPKD